MLVAFTALVVSQLAIAALLFGTLAIDRPEKRASFAGGAPAPFALRPPPVEAPSTQLAA